jgi:hypothetical protein
MRILVACCLTVAALPAQVVPGPQPESEYHVLSNPNRDPWQKPDQVIGALNFSASETVAVIENGYPYFASRIAPYVRQVYAVNADPRAFHGPVPLPPSVSAVVSTWTDPHISSIVADTVIMVDMLRFLPERTLYYLNLVAGLKSGGRLVIIDRQLPAVVPGAVNITSTMLGGELPAAGLRLGQEFTFLLPNEYFLVFQR